MGKRPIAIAALLALAAGGISVVVLKKAPAPRPPLGSPVRWLSSITGTTSGSLYNRPAVTFNGDTRLGIHLRPTVATRTASFAWALHEVGTASTTEILFALPRVGTCCSSTVSTGSIAFGLKPHTRYESSIVVNGLRDVGTRGAYWTGSSTGTAGPSELWVTSCLRAKPDYPTSQAMWKTILEISGGNAHTLITLGDEIYNDASPYDPSKYRAHLSIQRKVAEWVTMTSSIAELHMHDDHDNTGNNGDKNKPAGDIIKANNSEREHFPTYRDSTNTPTISDNSFSTFDGKVCLHLLDDRTTRSPDSQADDLNKHMFDPAVLTWLGGRVAWCAAHGAVWQFVMTGSAFYGSNTNVDGLRTYTADRNRIVHLSCLADGVIFWGGDLHRGIFEIGKNFPTSCYPGGAWYAIIASGAEVNPSSAGQWPTGSKCQLHAIVRAVIDTEAADALLDLFGYSFTEACDITGPPIDGGFYDQAPIDGGFADGGQLPANVDHSGISGNFAWSLKDAGSSSGPSIEGLRKSQLDAGWGRSDGGLKLRIKRSQVTRTTDASVGDGG